MQSFLRARARGAAFFRCQAGRGTPFIRPCSTSSAEGTARPTGLQLRRLFVNSAVPFIGFGMVDQTVLIYAGDTIDATLGVRLGLPTLGAAALGQVFSDSCGVLFGGTIEALALKLGLPLARLTDAQLRLGVVKRISTFGSVCGVILGCFIGMTNLLVVDLQATELAKKAEELRTIMKAVMDDGREVLGCTRATLWVVDEASGELWSSVAHGRQGTLRLPNSESSSIAGWVFHHKEMVNVPNVKQDPRWSGPDGEGYVPRNMLCAPVLKGKRVIAVIQVLDKLDPKNRIVPFDKNDEKLMGMLAAHVRIFMDESFDDDDDDSEGRGESYAEWLRRRINETRTQIFGQ